MLPQLRGSCLQRLRWCSGLTAAIGIYDLGRRVDGVYTTHSIGLSCLAEWQKRPARVDFETVALTQSFQNQRGWGAFLEGKEVDGRCLKTKCWAGGRPRYLRTLSVAAL